MIFKIMRAVAERLPPRLPELVYTVFLRPKPLRKLANRILLKIIPSQVNVENCTLYLNPNDPVLSPAVALGVYENYERELFRQFCRPGGTVLDIGANVGLYTVAAASLVGGTGTVIAIEPHPESFRQMQKTIQANGLTQVRAYNVAAGDRKRPINLFLTDDNQADSRVYDAGRGRRKITVQMVDIDGLLADLGIASVQLIKMDIQGAESLALQGLLRTLAASQQVVIFTEFWPWGIEQTGASAADFLRQLAADGFRFRAIDESRRRLEHINDIEELIARHAQLQYPGANFRRSHANLICIKDQSGETGVELMTNDAVKQVGADSRDPNS
jgi:FkbM family methyltransferase